MYFFDEEVRDMLNYAKDTDEIAKLIIEKQIEFSLSNVNNLFQRVPESSIDEIAELIIEKQTEFEDPIVYVFLSYAIDKQKIAELLQRKTDNITKLSNLHIEQLFDKAPDNNIKITIAKIINKYHKYKIPEIQELINKYLHEL
jgi:ABC-type transport system substrate-binding protein